VIQAVFFDWFNTIAHYFPPREALESQALMELGFSVSPQAINRGMYLADKYYYEENARLPIRDRERQEQTDFYTNYQKIVIREAGVAESPGLVADLMMRVRKLNAAIKFVLFEDAVPTLKLIKEKRLKIGLLSNLQREINSMCVELGVDRYVDFSVTSGDVGADKPRPPIFLRALELAGARPDETVHVGDQYQNDVVGARGVGINPILLDRNDLYAEITDCPRIKSLAEIANYI